MRAVQSPRLELILRHTLSGQKFLPRYPATQIAAVLPGTNHVLSTQLSLPTNLPSGSYDCF